HRLRLAGPGPGLWPAAVGGAPRGGLRPEHHVGRGPGRGGQRRGAGRPEQGAGPALSCPPWGVFGYRGAVEHSTADRGDAGRRHKVVVVGSGFGALFATAALKAADVEITLIARTTHHLFQPLLYQVATGILSEGEIAPSTREILGRQRNARVLLGEVTDIELAELVEDEQQRAALMTFVVVGAGPTGVEMAGQIAELAHRTLRHEFRRIDPRSASVILLDAAPSVLGSFGDRLGAKALAKLGRIGVQVQLGARVVGMDGTGIEVQDAHGRRRIDSVCKVWAAGVSASPLGGLLAQQCGAALDAVGRIEVQPDLTLPGHPEVFVVGDMVALDGLPGVAQVAIQGGRHAAAQISARLAGKPSGQGFEYHDKGSMAMISRFSAVASIGPLRLSGFPAWLAWLAVHLVYLIGFKNRLTTLLHWSVSFLGRGRSERTVTQQQVFARQAFDQLGEQFSATLSAAPEQDPGA